MKKQQKRKKILGIIHTDVCGPIKINFISGTRYFLIFINDKIKKILIYFFKSKNKVFERFEEFKALVENKIEKHIKILRNNNDGKYVND